MSPLWIALLLVSNEGQWRPDQIGELELETTLSTEELWGREDSLLRAVVNYGGCSAGFISPQGLIATNHHCAYGTIQANSSVEHNYLRDGFLARTKDAELPAQGRGTVSVLLSVKDVTQDVLSAAEGVTDDRARHLALKRRRAELVKACEADGRHRCNIASFYFGAKYELHTTFEIRDVRLVYAPPSSVGEYGGEIDNWMWPRHTGDFSLLRAYVGPDGKPAEPSPDNVPYRPKRYLEIGHEGVSPGDFVAVIGYPGHTDRYLPAVEIKRQVEQVLPGWGSLYRAWIRILDEASKEDPAVALKVAGKRKSFANREKNGRGMLDGIRRMRLLERRAKEDAQLALDPDNKRVLAGLAELSDAKRAAFDRDMLIRSLSHGPDLLGIAIDLTMRSRQQKKADLERLEPYMDRNARRLWKQQERRLKNFETRVDIALLSDVIRRGEIESLKGADAEALIRKSKLSDPTVVKRLFDAAELNVKDPLLSLAAKLAEEIEAAEERAERYAGALSRLGPQLIEMLKSTRSGPTYPDANGTLRFSYAYVRGYAPRDGLVATPQTTLAGAIDKHTGEDPFDLPERVRSAAEEGRTSYWADPNLEDVPICFLSNADTTGGNSGSPTIDRHGRLVGLNFDRVWENIAGDFGYNVERSRNIIADVRYLLFMLDRVEDAGELLEELGLSEHRTKPRRAPRVDQAPAPVRSAQKDPPGASCQTTPVSPVLLVGLLFFARRLRR